MDGISTSSNHVLYTKNIVSLVKKKTQKTKLNTCFNYFTQQFKEDQNMYLHFLCNLKYSKYQLKRKHILLVMFLLFINQTMYIFKFTLLLQRRNYRMALNVFLDKICPKLGV